MTLRVRSITFDCHDPCLLAAFWAQITGFAEDPSDPNLPEQSEALLLSPDGSVNLLFVRVPEDKQVKNRVHLDLTPSGPSPGSREAEVARILPLGASLVSDHRRPDGSGWITLADPEGNEFCVTRWAPAR